MRKNIFKRAYFYRFSLKSKRKAFNPDFSEHGFIHVWPWQCQFKVLKEKLSAYEDAFKKTHVMVLYDFYRVF